MVSPAATYDVIIIGAGAAGLMCAAEAGKRGRRVLLIDHAKKPAEKIRISGGGRCNFTNLHTAPKNFLSHNPHFCISALRRYSPQDFIALVTKHGIAYHEKTLGQLFCDGSSQQIIAMLLAECEAAQVRILLDTRIEQVEKTQAGFAVATSGGNFTCTSFVVASGGKSIPKMGATGLGYEIATQFGLKVVTPRAALVPLTFEGKMLESVKALAGVAAPDAVVACPQARFREAVLFTHRGMSGPAILQISSYWQDGETISLNFLPQTDVFSWLKHQKLAHPKQEPATALAQLLPRRFAQAVCEAQGVRGNLADCSHSLLQRLADAVNDWRIVPAGTEGFRTAEVTAGGVDTNALSSQTMECKSVPGLYFIGEVVDVTGHLGGFNFQWAWASGHAAGQAV